MNHDKEIDQVLSIEELTKRSYFMKDREAFPGFNNRVRALRTEMKWADARALVSEYVL